MVANDSVFHITELLVYILLELDPYDILRLQSTCRKFQIVILQSFRLRQKLFLEPDETASLHGNTLLDYGPQSLRRSLQAANDDWAKFAMMPARSPPASEAPRIVGSSRIAAIPRQRDMKSYSWHNMLPCQPPPSLVALRIPAVSWVFHSSTKLPLLLPREGEHITLGKIVDTIKRLWNEEPQHNARTWGPPNARWSLDYKSVYYAFGPQTRDYVPRELKNNSVVMGISEEDDRKLVANIRAEIEERKEETSRQLFDFLLPFHNQNIRSWKD